MDNYWMIDLVNILFLFWLILHNRPIGHCATIEYIPGVKGTVSVIKWNCIKAPGIAWKYYNSFVDRKKLHQG